HHGDAAPRRDPAGARRTQPAPLDAPVLRGGRAADGRGPQAGAGAADPHRAPRPRDAGTPGHAVPAPRGAERRDQPPGRRAGHARPCRPRPGWWRPPRSPAWPGGRAAPDPFPPRPGRPPPVRSRRHHGRCRMVFAPCHEQCTMATRDILTTLGAEHDELRQLFEQMEGTTDRAAKKRADLLARIKANLLPHAKWEETVFYPMFAE